MTHPCRELFPVKATVAYQPSRSCAVACLFILLFSIISVTCWGRESAAPKHLNGERVDVTVLARGSKVAGSTGNMESYLAFISLGGSNRATVAARLVYYYPDFQHGISDDQIGSPHPLRLRLNYASYCDMAVNAFVARHVFNESALAKMHEAGGPEPLPCFIVHP